MGQLVRFQRALHLVEPAPTLAAQYPLEVPGMLQLPHGQLTLHPAEEGAQQGVLVKGPLTATFATEGLQMRTGGHTRGIRELMRAASVPPWRRETLPLLTDAAGVALIPGVAVRDPGPELAGGVRVTATWISEAR